MSFNLIRNVAILGAAILVTPACEKSSPARPSVLTLPSTSQADPISLNLTSVRGTFVGMANEICENGPSVAIDDLTVYYEVSGRSLAGALLVACPTDDCEGATPLGVIAECPVPPNPCEAGLPPAVSEGTGSACFVGPPAGTGSLHAYVSRWADADPLWRVMAYFQDSGDRTNAVSTVVDQSLVIVPQGSSMDSARFAR
jgi:hypothetical protein